MLRKRRANQVATFKFILIFVVAWFLWVIADGLYKVHAAEPVRYPYDTIFTYTGDPVVFKWFYIGVADPETQFPGITYDLRILQWENEAVVLDVEGLPDRAYTWTPPRVGHFICQVRAVKEGEVPGPWTDSRNFISKEECGTCDGQVSFWVYAWPKPAGAGSIN